MENEEYAVPMAYVFCQENVQTKGKVIYYPIYMITFFKQVQAEEKYTGLILQNFTISNCGNAVIRVTTGVAER